MKFPSIKPSRLVVPGIFIYYAKGIAEYLYTTIKELRVTT